MIPNVLCDAANTDQGEEEIGPEGGISFTYWQAQRGDLQKAPLA